MPNIKIEKTTDDSLTLTARIGDVVRWESLLTKGSNEFVHIDGKQYRYDDLLEIWNQNSLNHDTSNGLTLPFSYYQNEAGAD
jgi:hypothetical protein